MSHYCSLWHISSLVTNRIIISGSPLLCPQFLGYVCNFKNLRSPEKISADKKFNTVLEFCAVPSGSSILRKEYVHVTTFTEN